MASGDFRNPATKVGIEVWRIEKLKAVPVDPKNYGTFYSGDCYIILKTYDDKHGKRSMDLFFWLGKDCSQDEQGAVAYKTVELDDQLGGKPVQYREVQNSESGQFKSLFPGLRYLDGGIESGFKHVEKDSYKPRLFHLKGKRHVNVQQVELSSKSMNEGDVFILDNGLTLYQWNGKDANKYEKVKGLEMVTKINGDERGARATVNFFDSGKNDNDNNFWNLLGGRSGVKQAKDVASDDEVKESVVQLFSVSDAGVSAVASGSLEKSMLDTKGVYIVDSGTQVFAWIGKNAPKDARAKGMSYAQKYLTQQGRPATTPLSRVVENAETPAFKALFKVWNVPVKVDFNKQEKRVEKPADFSALYQQQKAAEQKMVDNATGKLQIWRIENFDKVPLDPSMYGQFFSGDSYILLYQYKLGTRDMAMIYFWQGRQSSQDEKGASALLTKQLADELGTNPTQVRVVQNKEPHHFLLLFKGKMIVHEGGRAGSFKNKNEADSYHANNVSLYHVRGTNDIDTRAVQVAENASSLNSGDCFVLLTPSTAFAWCGKGSTQSEKTVASTVASLLQGSRKVTRVEEGQEPDAFWSALGGKAEYATSKELESGDHDPRLFVLSNASGGLKIEEIFNYTQDDLLNDDVMILDTFAEVFVWVGREANQAEKDGALTAALEYVQKAADGRDADTPVFQVLAGCEPPSFTCHFLAWDNSKAQDFSDPYSKKLAASKGGAPAEAKVAAAAPAAVQRVTAVQGQFSDPKTNKFSAADLKANNAPGSDPKNKELYLADDEFKAIFGCTQDEFAKQPNWKREAAKKKSGLF